MGARFLADLAAQGDVWGVASVLERLCACLAALGDEGVVACTCLVDDAKKLGVNGIPIVHALLEHAGKGVAPRGVGQHQRGSRSGCRLVRRLLHAGRSRCDKPLQGVHHVVQTVVGGVADAFEGVHFFW